MAEEAYNKEVLLKEIHPGSRTSTGDRKPPKPAHQEISGQGCQTGLCRKPEQIRSMAIAHERLYMSKNLKNIDAADYIRNLANYLLYSLQNRYRKVTLRSM